MPFFQHCLCNNEGQFVISLTNCKINLIENIPLSQVTAIFSAQQLPFTVTGQAQFNLMEIIPLRRSNQHFNIPSNKTMCFT